MRLRWWLVPLLAAMTAGLSGCAKLNEWLEGTVGEEETTDEETPEEKLAKAEADLAGTDAAKRKAAAAALFGINFEPPEDETTEYDPALIVGKALPLLRDKDDEVVLAVRSGLQTKTGFPEKTEDERQLDPEGYDKQLAEKTRVVEQGLPGLAACLDRDDESIRYRALIIVCNLTRPPIVPDGATDQLRDSTAAAVLRLALDAGQGVDVRLLAVEALVACEAGPQVGQLAPLLADEDPALRARVALAVGQAAAFADVAGVAAGTELAKLAADPKQPIEVRWGAAAALGRLAAPEGAELTSPFDQPEGQTNLEAYRTYALASSGAAAEVVAELNAAMTDVATKAEEELDEERKKGYR